MLPASCFLLLASCFLPLASCFLPLASCFLPLASCFLPLAPCLLATQIERWPPGASWSTGTTLAARRASTPPSSRPTGRAS
ncbi:MAG: hypothetical protein FJZ89_04850 [Chloroflexi bacterium]|nr:hypothetical protein [Chloroflexota bacterium]